MKPRTILLLAFMIFACVLGCMLGNFGQGITLPINGEPVTFKAFIPPIHVPGELLLQPTVDILGMKVGLYNTLFTTIIVDVVIIVLVLVGRSGLGEKPRNWFTNAWEGYIELLYKNYIVPTLGARSRAVLPIAVAVFTFIMVAGFFELLPGHESIGAVERVAEKGFCSVDVGGVKLITGVPVVTDSATDCAPKTASGAAEAALTTDTTAAKAMPGVLAVYTAADLADFDAA